MLITRLLIPATIVGGLLLWSHEARAWGDVGHKIVCAVAFERLNDQARAEVVQLIALDDEFETLADSCIWPDHPKTRSIEHYVNVSRTTNQITSAKCAPNAKCIFSAIAGEVRVLDTSQDDEAKLKALKYLGHWIGDLHQPLHVSFADDRGGNAIRALGPCSQGDLHAAWDSCSIETLFGSNVEDISEELVQEMNADPTATASWVNSTVARWANESFQAARRTEVQYCIQSGNRCVYEIGNETYEQDEDQKRVTVDAPYLATHEQLIKTRLKQAGVRLALLLNRTLGQ